MTDPTQSPDAQVASLGKMLVHDTAQKLLTTAAAGMAAKGFLAPGSQDQFVTLGVSVALYAASFAWTYVAAQVRRRRMLALKAATPQ